MEQYSESLKPFILNSNSTIGKLQWTVWGTGENKPAPSKSFLTFYPGIKVS